MRSRSCEQQDALAKQQDIVAHAGTWGDQSVNANPACVVLDLQIRIIRQLTFQAQCR
jgi:hypothetical protein